MTDSRAHGHRLGAIWAIAASLVLFAACAASTVAPSAPVASATTAPIASVAATPTPAATPAPTPSPTPTAVPTPLPQAKALCASGDGVIPPVTCKLPAGTYSAAPFAPVFRLTVGAGWTNSLNGVNAGQLGRDNGTDFTGLGWSTGAKAQGSETVLDATVDDLIRYMTTQPGVTATDPVAVTIGGLAGKSVDVTMNKGEINFRVGKSAVVFGPGQKLRAYVVEANGTVVFISVEVGVAANFDKEMAAAQPIIDSIIWQ